MRRICWLVYFTSFHFNTLVATSSYIVDHFMAYEEINNWLLEQCEQWSENAQCSSIGKTFLGKDIPMIKVFSNRFYIGKKAIFIEGGIHAREWASPASIVSFINTVVFFTIGHLLGTILIFICHFTSYWLIEIAQKLR